MQPNHNKCTECGGDGKREPLGTMEVPGTCTHCKGSGTEPNYRDMMQKKSAARRFFVWPLPQR